MPVFDDGLWWDLNWRWMAVWLATAAGLVCLLVLLNGARRGRRRPSERLLGDTPCVYLDDRKIMDVYQMNRYAAALRQEVELRTRNAWSTGLQLLPSLLRSKADMERSREVVTKYIAQAEPISVVGVIVDGLDRSDAVVVADLRHRTADRNAALRRARAERPRGEPFRLSTVDRQFVFLRGDFVRDEAASSDRLVVFTAPYGSDPAARVRLSCRAAGLRSAEDGASGSGSFHGVCLGKVHSWDPAQAVLDVLPLAVFG